jgi:hypothetical protein
MISKEEKMNHRKLIVIMMSLVMVLGVVQAPEAALYAVDPGPYTAATGFFPAWYQDTNAVALDLCLSTVTNPAVGGAEMCLLVPEPGFFDPLLPIAFPSNFPSESFYFNANALLTGPGVTRLVYVAGLEAAFGTGNVVADAQIVFARIRVTAEVTETGTYVVTHPYGEEVFKVPVAGARAITFTSDIGVAPGIFTGALKGAIGPFLKKATPGFMTVGTEQFIGDPNIDQTVTGSPFGTNFVRVSGPAGIIQNDQFLLAGKVSTVVLPTPLVVDRTTYSSNAAQTQIDVFAISAPTATVAFDVTGATAVPMGGDILGRYFGQTLAPPATLSPATITATLNPSATTVSPPSVLTDVVFITRAEYSLATGTLVIDASSSDETALPALTVVGFGTLGTALVPPAFSGSFTTVIIPPASVTVTSAAGGSDTEEVVVVP